MTQHETDIFPADFHSESRTLPSGVVVHAVHICSTRTVVLDAYDPLPEGTGLVFGGYSAAGRVVPGDERWYGRVTGRPLPADLAALPAGSVERYERVTAWQTFPRREAVLCCLLAYPELADVARVSGGHVEVEMAEGEAR